MKDFSKWLKGLSQTLLLTLSWIGNVNSRILIWIYKISYWLDVVWIVKIGKRVKISFKRIQIGRTTKKGWRQATLNWGVNPKAIDSRTACTRNQPPWHRNNMLPHPLPKTFDEFLQFLVLTHLELIDFFQISLDS